jgi:hypothetical protein
VATLMDFTAPYKPGRGFYTGKGISPLVPDLFPVALNARPYMLDYASNQYSRRFDARVRDSVDQSTEPGEAAINPQGLWRRSQSSWHYGAGQKYSDTVDAEPYRFFQSKGVDVWSKGELSLLPATDQARASVNTNLQMVTADARVYVTDGQEVLFTTDLSSFTAVTGTDASALFDIASDGYNVFYSYASGDIDQTNAGIGTNSNYVTGIEAGYMDYVKGRLMVAGQGADKHKIWNITTAPGSNVNNPTPLFSHANTNFNWVGFAAGQNHIYCAGFAGNKSLIYKVDIKPDATALTAPTVAGELPLGEVVQTVEGYLGLLLVGLQDGFRLCSSDSDGNLVIGPKIVIGSPVKTFAGVGKFVHFAYTNIDAASTGIGKMDISLFISPNQPVYASDLMVTGQGTVTDIHEFNDLPVFAVSGLGFYKQHATDLVASGYLDTGIYRWGISDAKFVQRYDLRTLPLAGSIQMSVKSDGGSYRAYVSLTEVLETEHILPGLEEKVFEHEARITLNRSATVNSDGPTLTRWMVRAYAAPDRSEIFTVPLLIHDTIDLNGRTFTFNVNTELNAIRDLVSNPRVVVFQEENAIHSVIVEDVVWQPSVTVARSSGAKLQGTAIVVMRTVR